MSLSDDGFAALTSIVTLAKGSSIRSKDELRKAALSRGLPPAAIDEAISYWTAYLHETHAPSSLHASFA